MWQAIGIIALIIFILVVAFGIFSLIYENNLPEEKRFNILSTTHIGGIPHLAEGLEIFIGFMPHTEKLTIGDAHNLWVDQIKRIQILEDNQLIEKQKSILKRAFVGGVLLGPAAAVVGGITGLGTYTETETQNFLSIDFIDKDKNELTAIFLFDKHVMPDAERIERIVNKMIGYVEIEEEKFVPTKEDPYNI